MSIFQKDQPLGLPAGSVRAIMGLLIVVPFVFLALKSGVQFTGDQVIGVITGVIAFYFIQKSGENI